MTEAERLDAIAYTGETFASHGRAMKSAAADADTAHNVAGHKRARSDLRKIKKQLEAL